VDVELVAVLAGLEELEVIRMLRVGGEAAAAGGSEWAGRASAGRSRDVVLDHRRHVVVLARVAGDDPAAGAVADDHDGVVAEGARRLGARAVRAAGGRVAAALDFADELMQ